MTRSAIIFLGTILGGMAIYVGLVKWAALAPKGPRKTIAFVASFVATEVVSTLATRRDDKQAGALKSDCR